MTLADAHLADKAVAVIPADVQVAMTALQVTFDGTSKAQRRDKIATFDDYCQFTIRDKCLMGNRPSFGLWRYELTLTEFLRSYRALVCTFVGRAK
jgi:hypothetical protein